MLEGNFTLLIAIFLVVTSLVLMAIILLSGWRPASTQQTTHDLFDLAHPSQGGKALPRIGSMIMPSDTGRRTKLRSRMVQAGMYRRHAMAMYLGFKVLFMVAPVSMGVVLSLFGFLPLAHGVLWGALVGLLGILASSFWINLRKSRRQMAIRRALPDALDVIVVCMDGGLSLTASLARVASELHSAHPLLAAEMSIVRREIQLGRTTGDALRQLAVRFDVDELRSLASVIVQSERFGASLTKALRIHADSLRQVRHQRAEAMAQKAPVKLIFPTVLFIFPALYIVLMGPAGVVLMKMFGDF